MNQPAAGPAAPGRGTSPAPRFGLETKPDFEQAMARLTAWFAGQVIDRPPVRFTRHNAEFEAADNVWKPAWRNLKDKWFDEEYQIERFMTQVRSTRYLGETFPIYWPNLGPNVFAAFYGCPLAFGEVTAWAGPILADYDHPPVLDWQSEYLRKIDSLTRCALEQAAGQFIVGYTDLHPGLDWVAALRGSEALCLDLIDRPADIKPLLAHVTPQFLAVYDHFDAVTKAAGQPSVTWIGVPVFGTLHIPSCDFATMISPSQFREFALPSLLAETEHVTHNIFHVDGKGVARHLDYILEMPKVQAIQWVQGVGSDMPIMQWVPLIKRVQTAGKAIMVDLNHSELDDFIAAVRPEGILLTMDSESEEQERSILERVSRW